MKTRILTAVALVGIITALFLGNLLVTGASGGGGTVISGGGTTMVQGGTGDPTFTPVITKFAFNWRSGKGHFECLALAPSAPAGDPGSGEFDTNVMYVTGPIDSAEIVGSEARFEGTSTVTGLGAGTDQHFTVRVTRGGPGATLVLRVAGLTFREILLEGQISFG